jgi:hypothetical protein
MKACEWGLVTAKETTVFFQGIENLALKKNEQMQNNFK